MCDTRPMTQIVCPWVSAEDRARLEAIVADRNRTEKHAARARIILNSAARLSVAEIARRAGVGRPAVWRWQRRFAEAGVDGLLHEATRKPGKAPLSDATVRRVLALTCAEPPSAATHWTGRALAKTAGISLRSVQRIWAAHRLQPDRIRTLKCSNDPAFAAKLEDIVGLYVDAPKRAIVLSVDQPRALDRTRPGLPVEPGNAAALPRGYIWRGMRTLASALNVLDSTVLGRCRQRHRPQHFLGFLNAVERAMPAGKLVHVVLDNGNHKHPEVLRWLARHPRFTFHFTPTSSSWLTAVGTLFSTLNSTIKRRKRHSFQSIVDLQTAIRRYVDEHSRDLRPFVWTKTTDQH